MAMTFSSPSRFLVLAAVLAAGACGDKKDEEKAKVARPTEVQDGVVAEGVVVPVRYATLTLPGGGLLRELPVREGDHVKEGQVLARLDTREIEGRLKVSRAEVARAEAALRQLKAGARAEEVAVREANLAQARGEVERNRSELNRLTKLRAKEVVSDQEVERARAAVDRAEAAVAMAVAELDLLRANARPEAVAVSEAAVAAARAAVSQVEATLSMVELRAPFDGTVVWLEARAGEVVTPGLPVVRIADVSRFVVRTEDLTELAVVRVNDGAQVTLTFDAIPGLSIPGRVTSTRLYGERKKGDMTYTVTVEPSVDDPRLRWNMTASVRIASPVDGGAPGTVQVKTADR
ncbi:MAG: efflux RND transporter periplasmic adaptor subunit [Deltaproteobacteria bacterium]|nr:efflux RND transporter periplasmic adaptor subunit [Deltaproteobacteria bacterium]